MRKKWLKRAAWILLTPVFVFVLLMILLYVPPVQNLLRKQVTAFASDATGMEISVDRIDLRFPLNLLVRGVLVAQPSQERGVQQMDTLLNLGSLNVRVQAWPLLKGQIEIDEVRLKQVAVNTAHLVDGMQLKGVLGGFRLESHGVNLSTEKAILNRVELSDTHLQVLLNDTTTTPPDTTSTALNWKIALHALKLNNVSVQLTMPQDSINLYTQLGKVQVDEAAIDLQQQFYGWKKFLLSGSALRYDVGNSQPSEGFDASHIALRDMRLGIDSVMVFGKHLNAVVRDCSMNERSGLSISSITGRLFADTSKICIPLLQLSTPHSQVKFHAQTYWKLINIPTTGRLSARFDAFIGKQDVLLFLGGMPDSFKESYPFRPLTIHAGTDGNMQQMQLSRFSIDLPGAFSLNGGGELWNLTDSVARNGSFDLEMQTQNLSFLTELTGLTPDGSLVIPDSMDLSARFSMDGPRYTALLDLYEQQGSLNLDATYDASEERYQAKLLIDSLQLHHFLPKDSLYTLSAHLSAQGRGTDFTSPRTIAQFNASLASLHYGSLHLSNVDCAAALKSALGTVHLTSNNPLLKMDVLATMRMNSPYTDGHLHLQVDDINLHRLHLSKQSMQHPFAFTLDAGAHRDSIRMQLNAGDLDFNFKARHSVEYLMHQSNRLVAELMHQIDERKLDHVALRRLLPSAGIRFKAGQHNPVSDYLSTQNISYQDCKLSFGFTPEIGINGRTAIHGLRIDSLQLDTIFFTVHQDTSKVRLQGGVINGPKNPQIVFRSTLTGELRSEDAELTANYIDGKGRTGLQFGVNVRPLFEGHGKGNGLVLKLIPQEPIIAYRKFSFEKGCDWIYLHKDMHVYANVDMNGGDGMGLRIQSDKSDTISLQNINVELNRFRLSELSSIVPYMPHITGLFSAEGHYIQTKEDLHLSVEANVRQLTYEKQPVGDIGMGATWLPGGNKSHYMNGYFTVDNEEAMTTDGMLTQQADGKNYMELNTHLMHFPLRVVNAFVPDRVVSLGGDLDGELRFAGSMEQPRLDGELTLDSVSVYARQAGARYWFDNRPVKIENNRLSFNKFAIYTTSPNPFTIDGYVDFRNLNHPSANLNLLANNYTLLDAPRTRESLVYGKVFVDLKATVRGPLDALVMRGNMNLLGNTDVTYVLTNSPLTVEDRLDGLVTFTSFADSVAVDTLSTPTMSLGGMDMIMTVHIDNAVQVRADLSTDRSKYVQLEGGGDLSLQYTPQGDMNVRGRYTLSGGIMKYSLPVIPLKEFNFTNGSYVDWRGDIMNPILNLKATERMRSSVADGEDGASRMVNFDVSIAIKNKLEAPELIFDIEAPDDASIQNELRAMGAEERSKQAIAMMATGYYLNNRGGMNMGSAALNSVLQSQINALAGSALESVGASFSVGVEDRTAAETGDKQTDYSFRYSQRFFNDRFQIIIGGKVSTGANATNNVESFIDNISLEYRLDATGTRYVRVFHNKNYESILDGEITETGVGLVLRKKMDRLGELFIFKKNKKKDEKLIEE